MRTELGVRIYGWALIFASALGLTWIAPMAHKMDALAPDVYYAQPGSSLGYGELELWVRDLRLAPLTLGLAGIAALVALRLGADRGRRVLAITGLILLCSPVLMGEYVGFDDWVAAALTRGYVAAVPGLQVALTLSGLGALLLAARRVTGWHVVMIGAAIVAAAWVLVGDPQIGQQLALFLLGWPIYVGLATCAATAGGLIEVGSWRRVVTAGVSSALLYLPVAWFCIPLNFALGGFALELNGGHIDVDGLPVYLAGPMSAVAAVFVYLTAVNRWTVLLPKAERQASAATPISGAT